MVGNLLLLQRDYDRIAIVKNCVFHSIKCDFSKRSGELSLKTCQAAQIFTSYICRL